MFLSVNIRGSFLEYMCVCISILTIPISETGNNSVSDSWLSVFESYKIAQ